jgi:hypothetical protein
MQIVFLLAAALIVLDVVDPAHAYVHDTGFWLSHAFFLLVVAECFWVVQQVRRILRGKAPVLVARCADDGAVSVRRPRLFPVEPALELAVNGEAAVAYVTAPLVRSWLRWRVRFAFIVQSPQGSIGTPLPWALDAASIDGFVAYLERQGVVVHRVDSSATPVTQRSSWRKHRR